MVLEEPALGFAVVEELKSLQYDGIWCDPDENKTSCPFYFQKTGN